MRFNIGHVLFLVHIPCLATDLAFVKYKKTKYANTEFASVIREFETISLIKCAAECDQTDACEAISYSPRGGICKHSKHKPGDKHAETKQTDGWSIYNKHDEPTSFTFGFIRNIGNSKQRVYVVASHPTNVTLTAPLIDYQHGINVSNGTEIVLPDDFELPKVTTIFPLGTILESNTSVDVYVENVAYNSAGGSSVIPTSHLSTEYVLLSWHESGNFAQFVVIGTVDSTVVNIVFENCTEKNLILNRNQVYHHGEVRDISGTFISSSEKIAVFAGHECSTVISDFCDHLYEQMPPIRDLQKEYIVSYPYPKYEYMLRIMTVEDNTEISLSDGSTLLLNRLNERQYLFNGVPIAITASKQIIVAVYSLGVDEAASSFYGGSMLIVPGLSQFKSEYNIYVPSDVHQGMLMITFPSFQTSITRMRLNHKKLVADESVTMAMIGRGQYTIMYKELSKGTSVIYTTDGTPFGAYLSLMRWGSQSWFSLSYKHV